MNEQKSEGGQEADLRARRAEANREELTKRIAEAVSEEGRPQPLEDLFLRRYSTTGGPIYGVSKPSLCVIAQGRKEILLGDSRHQYDPYHYLLATAELPITGNVLEASEAEPFLGLVLVLDPNLVSSVMVEAGYAAPKSEADVSAIDVSPLGTGLLDAVTRLVRLVETPDEAPVLAPMIKKEIIYRLLKGEQGNRLRHIAALNGDRHRIAQAVEQLHDRYDESIRIEDLAEDLGMSSSSFHRKFKALTDMTPLQFQKQLRLQEARRLMLGEELNASTAGYEVGYDDPSHFSREYKRFFGDPPLQDVKQLREANR
ncbi:MAG: AraC family transcriptional regulator [Salinivenus sp.]